LGVPPKQITRFGNGRKRGKEEGQTSIMQPSEFAHPLVRNLASPLSLLQGAMGNVASSGDFESVGLRKPRRVDAVSHCLAGRRRTVEGGAMAQ
jgi:hypothetical protein